MYSGKEVFELAAGTSLSEWGGRCRLLFTRGRQHVGKNGMGSLTLFLLGLVALRID